jgi:hypothetical protein
MRDNTVTPFYRQSGNSDRNINRQTNQPIGNNYKPHYVSNDHQHDKGNGRNYKVAREFNIVTLGNGGYKKVCGFCTFVHTMWKGTKLHREFTSDIHSYKKNVCNILPPHYK